MKACGVILVVSLLSGCRLTRGEQPTANPATPEPDPCRAGSSVALKADDPSSRIAAFDDFLREYRASAPERRGELARVFIEQQRAAGGFPIVASDGTAVFFYLGAGTEREVRLVGDFKIRNFYDIYWD